MNVWKIISFLTLAALVSGSCVAQSQGPASQPDILGNAAKARNENGATRLHFESYKGNLDLVKFLVKYKADLNAQTKNNSDFELGLLNNAHAQTTALMLAAFKGYPKVVRFLLDQGAKVNLQDSAGQTALTYAILSSLLWPDKPLSAKHKKIILLLLEYGADPHLKDVYDQDPAYYFGHLYDANPTAHAEIYPQMK